MKLFYDLKISAKLYVGFLALLALSIFLGLFSIFQLAKVNQTAFELGTNWMPSVNAAMGIKESLSRIRSQEAQVVSAESPEDAEKYVGRVKEAVDSLKKYEEAYSKLLTEPEEKKQYAEYSKLIAQYLSISGKMAALAREGNGKEASALLRGDSSKTNSQMRHLVDNLVKINIDGGNEAYRRGTEIYANSRIWIIALLLASVVIGLLLAYALARVVAGPLAQAVRLAQTVAAGDLTSKIEVTSKDETGMLLQALKDMNSALLNVVSEVRRGTDEIATASGEIASGNLELSARTEAQAGALEETASSMEELTSTVKQNSDNARQANQLAQSASDVAQKGGGVVADVVSTMGSINESSKKIVDIIGVIDGIAFQTNILALNAAVEAARAGEQGRGFAVVASEVRNLAQRSASAAKEIKELINDSVAKVDQGSRLVDQAGSTMNEVVQSVKRVSDIISEITAAGQEQSAGIDQINIAITQMDQTTQQNAALVEEAAAAAGTMQEHASNLSQVVSVFRLDASFAPSANIPASNAPTKPGAAAKPQMKAKALPKPAAPARPATSAKAVAGAKTKPKAKPVVGGDSGDWEEF